jgi:uncharacterized protein YkwD
MLSGDSQSLCPVIEEQQGDPDMKTRWIISSIIVLLLVLMVAHPGQSREAQNNDRLHDELMTVYLGNLARRDHGVPPLRANMQLTRGARWFAWDSVENRPEPYCGHQDSRGLWPGDRAQEHGYKGMAGAENAFCGYVSPADAIQGWLNSPRHRDNLLCDCHREIGLGYYLGAERGYVAQVFGYDPVYPPVIIENEALSTTTPQVGLYIHSSTGNGDIVRMGAAVEMMVSNDPSFAGAVWEPYAAEKTWTLKPGEGWRTVYVKTRDDLGRTTTVSDMIYLGETLPREELSDMLMSTTQSEVTITATDESGWLQVQFSPNWLADDDQDMFTLFWGNGEQVTDSEALGTTAFRLFPGDGESLVWFSTADFIQDVPLVAYFRVKTNNNTSSDEIARLSVDGGGVTYGPVRLRGTDFDHVDEYQEFAIPFTFHDDPATEFDFLNFKVWRSGSADVFIDTVAIFTAPQPVNSTITWELPGDNYRRQGIQVRYVDEQGNFSPVTGIDGQGRVIPYLTMDLAVSARITVTVTDKHGTVMANEPIEFSTDYGTVLPANTTTDAQGLATVIVVAEDAPGTATVKMTVDGITESIEVRFDTNGTMLYLPIIVR